MNRFGTCGPHSRWNCVGISPTCRSNPSRSACRQPDRRGSAIVELALLMPVLGLLLLGICELGQALRVEAVLAKACRSGCASACRPGGDNSDVQWEVETALTEANLPSAAATVTVLVNDVAADAATAQRNDKITVIVSIPTASVRLFGTNYFLPADAVSAETTIMLKQG